MDSQRGGRFSVGGVPSGHVHKISDIADVQTRGAEAGDILVWNGGAWVTRPVTLGLVSTRLPNAPAVKLVSGMPQFDSQHATASTIITVGIAHATTYDDGAKVEGVDQGAFVAQWHYADARMSGSTTWASVIGVGSHAAIAGVLPGYMITVRAATTDRWGRLSPWSDPYAYDVPALPTTGSRRQVTQWTGTLADLQTMISSVTLAKSYRIIHIRTDQPARVRLYATATSAALDVDRPVETLPESTVGCWLDFVTDGAMLESYISPPADGSNFPEPVVPS